MRRRNGHSRRRRAMRFHVTRRRVTRALSRTRRREQAAEAAEHTVQPTAAAVEAARTGVVPLQAVPNPTIPEIPGSAAEKMCAGDADVSPLQNEYSGEEVPGGSTPAPDQNSVDEIGRAYGVTEEDTGSLRTSSELLDARDRRRRKP